MATKTKETAKSVDKKTKKAAKQPKVSVNAFEKVAKANPNKTTITWNNIEVVITPTLSMKNMMRFVSEVIETCFIGDVEMYMPELKDFLIKLYTLELYTNFTLPRNVEKQYELIYNTDAFETVLMQVNQHQFNEICWAIDKKLEHRAAYNVADAEKRLGAIMNSIEDLGGQLSDVFEGIDGDTMAGLVNAMQDGKLDESKLIKEYFAQKPQEVVEAQVAEDGE